MCRIVPVVDSSDGLSGNVTGVTTLVVSAEMAGGEVAVLSEGEVWRGEEVVEAVLGRPAGVVVVGGTLSTVMTFVVTVSAVVIVLETVVLSGTAESETSADGVEVIVGVTVDVSVDISPVSLVGELLVRAGSSTALVVRAALGDLSCVVVKRESVGLAEEVNQNRAVTAKGALLVLDVMGLDVLTVELAVLVMLVTVVSGGSVTLAVDSGSRTSGLTIGGVVGSDGGPAVLESSGFSEGVVVGGRVGSSGAGETSAEGVCVLTVANVEVGPVNVEVDDVVVLMGRVVILGVVVTFVTGEDGVTGGTVTGALMPVTTTCVCVLQKKHKG